MNKVAKLRELGVGENHVHKDVPEDSRCASASTCSRDNTRPMSSSSTKPLSSLPIPNRKSALTSVPKFNEGSMSCSAISRTSLTASTMMPTGLRTALVCTSRITKQVLEVCTVRSPRKRTPRSSTGTAAPRRLITPRMLGGNNGTLVIGPYSMISRTLSVPTANISLPSSKVRYWLGLEAVELPGLSMDSAMIHLGSITFRSRLEARPYASRSHQAGHLIDTQNMLNLQQRDKLASHLDHPPDEVGTNMVTESWGGLDIDIEYLDHFTDRVQHHRTAKVNDPSQEQRHHRHGCHLVVFDDFTNTQCVDRIHFLSSQEGQVLQGFIDLQRWLASARRNG